MKLRYAFFVVYLITGSCFGQKQGQALVDSLIRQIPVTTNDSLKIRLVKKIADEYFFIDTEQALKYSKLGLALATKIQWQRAVGSFNSSIARAYSDKGNFDSCMSYNNIALTIQRKADDKFNIVTTLNNMGAAEQNLATNYPKATKYYFNALQIGEALKDKSLTALCYDNLSHIYFAQSNYTKALDYAFKSLRLRAQQQDEQGADMMREVGNALANIGSIYTETKDSKNAQTYYRQALPMLEKSGNQEGLAKAYSNLSILSGSDYKRKFEYGLKSREIVE